MNASRPPRLASVLVERLASVDPALMGDLEEAYRQGRSRTWYWRQVLAFILLGPARQIAIEPLRSIRALVIGWAALTTMFGLFDQFIAGRFGTVGYQTGVWWPFWLAAFLASYVGFAVSAWIVVRFHRVNPGPLLILYVASVVVAMAAGAAIVQLRSPLPTPAPHVLFPLVSVTLPYQWRSGFLLVPMVMLIAGMIGSVKPPRHVKHAVPR